MAAPSSGEEEIMAEIYPEGNAGGAGELLSRLLPGYDADALVAALVVERDSGQAHAGPAGCELARARAMIARGEGARDLRHAFNNPLTALLAEAQLLLLEDLSADSRSAAERILHLSRRLAALTRELDIDAPDTMVG